MADTYHNVYMNARARLRDSGNGEFDGNAASLEARFMLMAASGKTHEQLLRDSSLFVTPDVYKRFSDMLSKRMDGQPLAYVTGSWNFYGIPLVITPDVLIPRMDTEVLAEAAIGYAKQAGSGCRVLDLCSGSGCVALAIAKNVPAIQVTVLDISEAALQVARTNARALKLLVTAITGDVKSPPLASLGLFDVITANPPYIPTKDIETLDVCVHGYEPRLALDGGADGLDYYRSIATHWQALLKPGGRMLVEMGAGAYRLVREVFLLAGFTGFDVIKDTNGIERVLTAWI